MVNYGERGWLFSLKEGSNWGKVDTFYRAIFEDAEQIDDQTYLVKSDVWGTISTKSVKPRINDGIAFYHSSGARYSSYDQFDKKRRISLIGKITNVKCDKRGIRYLEFTADKHLARLLKINPILRDDRTEELFQGAGLVKYKVATLYYSNEENWSEIISFSGKHLESISDSAISEITGIQSETVNHFGDLLKISDDLALIGRTDLAESFIQKIIESRNHIASEIDFPQLFFSFLEFYDDDIVKKWTLKLLVNCQTHFYTFGNVIDLLNLIVEKHLSDLIEHKSVRLLVRKLSERISIKENNHFSFNSHNLVDLLFAMKNIP